MAERSVAPSALGWALIAAGALLHLATAPLIHLSPDEAHYALYALHPDWSYFDHPPLVGWVQWPAVQFGGSDVLLRLVPMACWVLCAWQVFGLAQRWALANGDSSAIGQGFGLNQERKAGLLANLKVGPDARLNAGEWAVLLLLLSPMLHLLGLALVPDTLLMPISLATLAATERLCDAAQLRRLRPWLVLGLCLGLAGLAKYTAVMLAVGALAALLLAHGWALLRCAEAWLAVALALALVSPVLIWNAQHQWISLAYQFGHAGGGSQWQAWRPLVFIVVQALAYGALPLAALAQGFVRPMSPAVLAACFALPLLALLVFLSGKGSTLPHWAAPAWTVLLPAAAAGLRAGFMRPRLKPWLMGLLVWQGASCVLVFAALVVGGGPAEQPPQSSSLPGEFRAQAPANPLADLVGWDAAAKRAVQLARSSGVDELAVTNWSLASRLGWYARPMPVQVVHRHDDQFDIWFGGLQPGHSVLWVDWSLMSFEPPVGSGQFAQCQLLEQLPAMKAGRQLAHFNFSLCEGWQGPPRPRPGMLQP